MTSWYGDGPEHGVPSAVTLFGSNHVLDDALSDELGQRGCRTHRVTVKTGWLSTATDAVIRIDTPAGAEALRDLGSAEHPSAHVVATCTVPLHEHQADLVRDLCRRCGERHDFSLIWHPSLVQTATASRAGADLSTRTLAATVADELLGQAARDGEPSFSTRSFTSV